MWNEHEDTLDPTLGPTLVSLYLHIVPMGGDYENAHVKLNVLPRLTEFLEKQVPVQLVGEFHGPHFLLNFIVEQRDVDRVVFMLRDFLSGAHGKFQYTVFEAAPKH